MYGKEKYQQQKLYACLLSVCLKFYMKTSREIPKYYIALTLD